MKPETHRALRIVASWLQESVSANDLDRLMEHANGERVETAEKYEIAETLRKALGVETWG